MTTVSALNTVSAVNTVSAIHLSLVSHTNVGKTTLARTLLRRDIGEVLDQAHVTEEAERHSLIETEDGELLLWDTPGFGDSARLLKRLRNHDRPFVWFFQKIWDRVTDRPFWCGQQAALNIRDQADVVLYLVNAAEEPEDAGYVLPELELLDWIGKPVVIVLNQTGDLAPESDLMALRLDAWRRHVRRFEAVRDVLTLDAFGRCWVQEGLFFERLVDVLPASHKPRMRGLHAAWTTRNLRIFDHSLSAMASYLARAAGDREALAERRPGKEEKQRAMEHLAKRLDRFTHELTRTLLAVHELEGEAAEEIENHLDAFLVVGEEKIDPERGAILGGILSGALGGLSADILAGGLTFGGGVLAGAILGALGGAGLARGYQMVQAGKTPAVSWSPAFLDRLTERTLLRYLAIAHFGRGRGEFAVEKEPDHWRREVISALKRDAEGWTAVWKGLAKQAEARLPGVRQSDLSPSTEMIRPWLERATRSLLAGLYPRSARWLVEDGQKDGQTTGGTHGTDAGELVATPPKRVP